MTDQPEYVTRAQLDDVVAQTNAILTNHADVMREVERQVNAALHALAQRMSLAIDDVRVERSGPLVLRVARDDDRPRTTVVKRVETDEQGRITRIVEEPAP